MFQIEYTKKPSIISINSAIKKALKQGETWIQLTWGENQITIEKTQSGWNGQGWIGKHGGHDIAHELTTKQNQSFIREHFQIIHIK